MCARHFLISFLTAEREEEREGEQKRVDTFLMSSSSLSFVIVSVLVSSCAVVFVVVGQLCLALTQNNGKHFSTFHFSHRLAQGEVCRERENAGGRAQVRQADIA